LPRIRVGIKTAFGEIEVSGETAEEVLEALEEIDESFLMIVDERVSSLMMNRARDSLKGIIEIRGDGPIITTKKRLTHYEAIGLILYSMKDHQASSGEIKRCLAASGRKVTVPARLHEMRRRGYIFKPAERSPIYKLSTKGVKWIEEEVLPQLTKR
jgi:hypothetical protein